MRHLLSATLFSAAVLLAAGASGCKEEASCERVVDHTLELVPEKMKEQMGEKSAMIEKCKEETTEAERKCALEAEDMTALMKCREKGESEG